MRRRLLSTFVASAVVAGLSFSSPSAVAVGIDDYTLTRTFTLPTPAIAFSGVLIDSLGDGRLLAVNGTEALVETTVASGTFTPLGPISGFATAFGGSFLAVSPDGTKAALGSNGSSGAISVFDTASPATSVTYTAAANDFDAVWDGNARLLVSNAAGVQALTLAGGGVKTVIGSVGGASGGVTLDAVGNLYTGNGFDTSATAPSQTGTIKAFASAAWQAAAAAGGAELNFETGGTEVADLLSAGSLGFDASGNFFVGGGEAFVTGGDNGYAALVSAAAAQAALAGGTPVDMNSPPSGLRKFATPQSAIDAFATPIWAYNDATGELYLRYFGQDTVSVFAVPEPAGLAGLMLAGAAVLRRRRRAIAGVAVVAATTSANAAYTFDANDFAVEVVASTNLPATGLYNDPAAVLGRPTLRFNSGNVAVPDLRRAKLIEGTFNTGPNGEKLITTFAANTSLTVRMGRPVTDDPSHPFGIDLNVFGNAFFTPGSIGPNTGDSTNLNTTTLGGLFAEDVRVSVSPDNVQWHTFDGPTGDGYFPTTAYRWNRAAAAWSDEELDATKPVDPAYRNALVGLTAADALDRYNGSAGGAGFDLADSPFASIWYVRFDGLTGFSGGEIDAVAAVTPEPALLGLASLFAVAALRRSRR